MKIGEFSRRAGVSVDTVRYYEGRGLLPEARRTVSGYRVYTGEDLMRLRFIVHAKDLGFTLQEIGRLLSIRSDGRDCESVKALARSKAAEIESRIRKMARMRRVLLDLAARCSERGGIDPCPILKSLEEEEG